MLSRSRVFIGCVVASGTAATGDDAAGDGVAAGASKSSGRVGKLAWGLGGDEHAGELAPGERAEGSLTEEASGPSREPCPGVDAAGDAGDEDAGLPGPGKGGSSAWRGTDMHGDVGVEELLGGVRSAQVS